MEKEKEVLDSIAEISKKLSEHQEKLDNLEKELIYLRGFYAGVKEASK
jgi:hypothetical protein